ncbi:hypothetical protein [Acinetobacter baumannii]|uniref:hypothetical protein n=1 Tax=Acinetobacter baumannii TaxID=470 RepID=UPI0037C11897
MTLQVIYSNKNGLPSCDVGIEAKNIKSVVNGEVVHTGDVVLVWHGHYVGTDDECWYPADQLTTVLFDQYGYFSNGEDEQPFVMFYKNGDFENYYKVQVVKSHKDIVSGEHWTFKGGCSISYIANAIEIAELRKFNAETENLPF